MLAAAVTIRDNRAIDPIGCLGLYTGHQPRRTAMTLTNQNYFTKTGAELNYIIRDAGEAAKAMRGFDAAAEAKYLEQINDACTVLHSRRKAA